MFFFRDNSAFLIAKKTTNEILPNLEPNDVESYKQLLDYASNHNIDGYEILLDKSLEKPDKVLGFISDYLLDKEISIGLLTKDQKFIDSNRKLLKHYGVTIAYPISRVAHPSPKSRPNRGPDVGPCKKLFFANKCALMDFRVAKSAAPRTVRLKESFHEYLLKLMLESGMDNAEIYTRGGITRQVFSKIMCTPNLIPKKETVICLCIGLKLRLFEAQALLKTAGYVLSESIMLDSIVMKYLEDEIYDLNAINCELDEFSCPLLGWRPRDN